jgi:hypothetical protein
MAFEGSPAMHVQDHTLPDLAQARFQLFDGPVHFSGKVRIILVQADGYTPEPGDQLTNVKWVEE